MATVRYLIDYLPLFMQEYIEIQKIDSAEQVEIDDLLGSLEDVWNNQFINTLTENGCSRWENMLNLDVPTDDTLESRRSRILAKLNTFLPITMISFKDQLITLQGNDNVTVVFNGTTYTLTVTTHMENRGQVESLIGLFEILPCNLVIVSNNYINANIVGEFGFGASIADSNIEFITNDIRINANQGINEMFGNAITNTEFISICSN